MTEPRKDSRKRDRAAYMRDYRAGRKKDLPTLTALAKRVAELEEDVRRLMSVMPDPILSATRFGRPRPAPKGK